MSCIDTWRMLKKKREDLITWHSLLGKRYVGGGGGNGSLVKPTIAFQIYYQEYDGANNYHPTPGGYVLNEVFEKVGIQHFERIYADVLEELDRLIAEAAVNAKAELDAIVADLPKEKQ